MIENNVKNPQHYKAGNGELIDVIQTTVKDFGSVCQANMIKYAFRADKKHKDPRTDIEKIIRYGEFWLNDLEGKKASEPRVEEIAVFDKLNDLLNEQEKEFLKDKKIECIFLNGTKIAEEAFEKLAENIIKEKEDRRNGKHEANR